MAGKGWKDSKDRLATMRIFTLGSKFLEIPFTFLFPIVTSRRESPQVSSKGIFARSVVKPLRANFIPMSFVLSVHCSKSTEHSVGEGSLRFDHETIFHPVWFHPGRWGRGQRP